MNAKHANVPRSEGHDEMTDATADIDAEHASGHGGAASMRDTTWRCSGAGSGGACC